MQQGEQEYLLRAQKDPKEFRFFYDKYYRNIFLFIYRRTDDEELSADITSQVFLKALQHLTEFKFTGAPFGAWLYRIASNEVAQHFRDQNKVRTVSLDKSDLNEMFEDDSSIITEERTKHMFDCIKKLNAEELEMIEMRFFEKRSFSEIAEIKNMTENNAKVKTYRILERLHKMMTVEV